MDAYKAYSRGGYGRGMNGCGNQQGGRGVSPGRSFPMPPDNGRIQGQMNMSTSCGCSGTNDNSNDCGDDNPHMRHMSVGMGYVPMQQWGELYQPDNALCQGTAFPDLNLIFCGSRGKV